MTRIGLLVKREKKRKKKKKGKKALKQDKEKETRVFFVSAPLFHRVFSFYKTCTVNVLIFKM